MTLPSECLPKIVEAPERRLAQAGEDIQKALEAAPDQWREIAARARAALDAIEGDGDSIGETLTQRAFNPAIEPPPLRAIYSLAGHCIATPGNLDTITAHIKTGKSALIDAMMASTMTRRDDAD